MSKLTDSFEKVCAKIVEKNQIHYGISSPQAAELDNAVSDFQAAILEMGVIPPTWSYKYGTGKGNLATVMWVVFLPPEQTAQDGIYVSCCFGKTGNGLVAGCAISNTSQKKYSYVPTVVRNHPVVDVDGTRPGTHYNNGYVNPCEFLSGNLEENRFKGHLILSVQKCEECLKMRNESVVANADRYEVWQAFLDKWPADKIQDIKLGDYTSFGGKRQSFCNWLEIHTNELGSIWGGSSYKFGVFQAKPGSKIVKDSTRNGDGTYKWYKLYGETAEEVFAYVKKTFSEIAEAVSVGNLSVIDDINFGHAVKWKVAFLYQPKNHPVLLPIYNKKMLCLLTGKPPTTATSALQKMLIQQKPADKDLFDYYDELLERLPQDDGETENSDGLQTAVEIKSEIEKKACSPIENLKDFIGHFSTDVSSSGLKYPAELTTRFVCAQLAKPFVILTGLSGSGKTKLAEAFTTWIGVEHTAKIVPVGADWTSSEKLLGYPNALDTSKYVLPDTGVLKLLIDAHDNPDIPFFLTLDEMNLSHVERYFADFLSTMESEGTIKLYDGKKRFADDDTPVPPTLPWPKNLFVIGTMNVDETTYMFSPKVLDRAQVIEFRVKPDEMAEFVGHLDANDQWVDGKATKIDLSQLAGANGVGKGAKYTESFLRLALARNEKKPTVAQDPNHDIPKALNAFFKPLAELGAEFGYRSASEILSFCGYYLDTGATIDAAIDAAVVQKLLPKLHGSQVKLEPTLEALAKLCWHLDANGEPNRTIAPIYALSADKVDRMIKRLEEGYASFAEA